MFRRPDGTWEIQDREMNLFAMACYEAVGSFEEKDCPSLSRQMYSIWEKITDILQEVRYYDCNY